MLLRVGVHVEERAAYVNHFPRKEKGKPGQANEGGSTGTEDIVAAVGVNVVTVIAKITYPEPEEDEHTGAEAESSHP